MTTSLPLFFRLPRSLAVAGLVSIAGCGSHLTWAADLRKETTVGQHPLSTDNEI